MKSQRIHKVIKILPLRRINICIKPQSNLSNSCWNCYASSSFCSRCRVSFCSSQEELLAHYGYACVGLHNSSNKPGLTFFFICLLPRIHVSCIFEFLRNELIIGILTFLSPVFSLAVSYKMFLSAP